MKIFLCVVATLSLLVLARCEPPAEIKKLYAECAKEIGLPEEIPSGLPNFEDPKVKCTAACIMKKKGDLIDGKVVPEKTIEFADKHFPGGASDAIKADIVECAGKANEEKGECEVAGAFHKCFKTKHMHPGRE